MSPRDWVWHIHAITSPKMMVAYRCPREGDIIVSHEGYATEVTDSLARLYGKCNSHALVLVGRVPDNNPGLKKRREMRGRVCPPRSLGGS